MELNVILSNKRDAKSLLEEEYSVYFLIEGEEIIYIGKSTNYQNRLHQHKIDKEFDSFYVHSCKNRSEMEILEFKMIAKYKPILNKTLPTVEIYPSANKLKSYLNMGAWEFKRFLKKYDIKPFTEYNGLNYYEMQDLLKGGII